jgi:hypothetical protein
VGDHEIGLVLRELEQRVCQKLRLRFDLVLVANRRAEFLLNGELAPVSRLMEPP